MKKERARDSKGRLVVISGPSGSGKTSICQALLEDRRAIMSVSVTTRPKRESEVEGRDYFFLTEEDFEEKIKNGEFLEHARYDQNLYGTLRSQVEEKLTKGHIVLLEIEMQGTRLLREQGIDATFIFIVPPSLSDLAGRLRKRRTESEEAIKRRLKIATEELDETHLYDHVVINRDLDRSIDQVRKLLALEGSKDGG